MERTARMLRRTLLCAAFACPLAAIGAMWGVLSHCLCTPLFCTGAKPQKGWHKARGGFAYAAGRALCAAGVAVGVSLAGSKLIFSLLPSISPWMAAALRLLINGCVDQIISCCRKADSLNQRLRFRLWRRLCFFRL